MKDEAKQRDDIKESVNKVIKCVSDKLATGKYAPLGEADVIPVSYTHLTLPTKA